MPPDGAKRPQFRVGHLLYLDLVVAYAEVKVRIAGNHYRTRANCREARGKITLDKPGWR